LVKVVFNSRVYVTFEGGGAFLTPGSLANSPTDLPKRWFYHLAHRFVGWLVILVCGFKPEELELVGCGDSKRIRLVGVIVVLFRGGFGVSWDFHLQ